MSKRKFCWMYYDTAADQIVQVKKPHRRVVDPKMTVYACDEDGNLRDYYTTPVRGFSKRYIYLGGLNHGVKPETIMILKPVDWIRAWDMDGNPVNVDYSRAR